VMRTECFAWCLAWDFSLFPPLILFSLIGLLRSLMSAQSLI
jgi:hypothetical protein